VARKRKKAIPVEVPIEVAPIEDNTPVTFDTFVGSLENIGSNEPEPIEEELHFDTFVGSINTLKTEEKNSKIADFINKIYNLGYEDGASGRSKRKITPDKIG